MSLEIRQKVKLWLNFGRTLIVNCDGINPGRRLYSHVCVFIVLLKRSVVAIRVRVNEILYIIAD